MQNDNDLAIKYNILKEYLYCDIIEKVPDATKLKVRPVYHLPPSSGF